MTHHEPGLAKYSGRLAPRWGFTAPLPGPLHLQRDAIADLADLGYTDAWSAEVDGADAFTPLAMIATCEPRLRVGTAIIPAFTRSPTVIAQTAATLADIAPDRFLLGIGSSSPVVVESWNGTPFEAPYQRTRDVVRFVREALSGQRITRSYDSFSIDGFRLQRPPEVLPQILVAALRPGMVRLGVDEGDGVIVNFVSPDDVARIASLIDSRTSEPKEIVARLFVCPTEDREVVRATVRRVITTYLNVPAYAEAQRWHGRAPELSPMWAAWQHGDRNRALELVPDSVIDDLFVHGSPNTCRQRVKEYFTSGLTAASLSILGTRADDVVQSLRDLAPGVTT